MPKRDDPQWSARATEREDETLERIATALGCGKGTALRAAVWAARLLTIGQLEEALEDLKRRGSSAGAEKVPGAAAVPVPPRAPERAGADSSPAPASARLLDVVRDRLGNASLARRAIVLGDVKVAGVVSKNPDRNVDPSDVSL